MAGLRTEALQWAAHTVAPGARVAEVRGMRDGSSPWLIRWERSGAIEAAVLRVGGSSRERLVTETAALHLAERHALAAPRVLATDLDGKECGEAAFLTTVLPGTSRIPRSPSPSRLRALGAAAAALHAVATDPAPGLPFRRWPMDTSSAGFVMERDAPADSPLRAEVRERLAEVPVPQEPSVLVHGDLWQGNTMWAGDECTGLVDWDCAGAGAAGSDLGNLRCDAAILAGLPAAEQVLDGWQQAAGRPAEHVAYWDLTAALSTPADPAKWLPAMHGQGRTDLTAPTVYQRRDAFLQDALDRLVRS
ncbi:aminoglycoside phosphotransferase family protein [Amycolatopsis jiangsuensis]|uniref:Aminoglycoside phosphotransferase (APT) family kinase protein n=1 Tax=Amycolatopsis jiangsuensis TaxID=1181879 RepID=A0A840IKR6_9PSEU|nr:aminoglycoside phosphotransferase family protein [Amycolatopsis jiangsuensis]MBB4682921.1 aminoglycoside phosphotransferase (APT) family kinase protein [Amycolatopsis jiangsuensis]